MKKIQLEQVPVYCLHIRKYRETSVILQCLSEKHGRFDLIGKGLYRSNNKNDLPEYFKQYRLSGICRNELGILTGLELVNVRSKLVGRAWLVGNYANEILIKFLPRLEPVPELFFVYENLLKDLYQGHNYQLSLMWFEKRILDVLGYGINFNYEYESDSPIESQNWYEYNTSRGFYLSNSEATRAIPGNVVRALADENWTKSESEFFPVAKRVIRSALKYQLGDVELQTVSVSKDLQQYL
jgi:DNA repair protein RecO (recombination protein O)